MHKLGGSLIVLVLSWLVVNTLPARAANPPRPDAIQSAIETALLQKGADYKPRTAHFKADGRPAYTNRLILEDSPYLLQHAHNPVDWFPWGSEAFEKAAREGKPVFLSIGYSTCHWCHVMEKESFDDPQIAEILNRHFISIKVDRERRPDIDATYMMAVMMINGSGGWPMSSFLTPDGKTFFGGTYYPPEQFRQIVQMFADMWTNQQADLAGMADRVAAAVASDTRIEGKRASITYNSSVRAKNAIMKRFDPLHGGFGPAPKFPNEALILFLQNQLQNDRDDSVESALDKTLQSMAMGGIYDQIGGGFHRYSTDEIWRIPHFEKMLYNQAHLAQVYLQAYRLTGNWYYQRVARQTLDYVLRDMASPEGAFYSATDADSEGREGAFFLWTPLQIHKILKPQDAELISSLYGVTSQGNFEGANILNLGVSLDDFAASKQISARELVSRLDTAVERMRDRRDQRERPFLDRKVVTAWNAMMISSLAMAADILNEPRYLQAATRAAQFLLSRSRSSAGQLRRIYFNGQSSVTGTQDDYAYLVQALVALYDVTANPLWLEEAEKVTDWMITLFLDKENGGFYMNQSKGHLMARIKDVTDSAIPSGNSVAVAVLARLARRTGNAEYRRLAARTVAAFSDRIVKVPSAYAYMLIANSELSYGENGERHYAANGKVIVNSHVVTQGDYSRKLLIDLQIMPGWHINSAQPLQKDLVPASLTLSTDEDWIMPAVSYPAPIVKSLGVRQRPMAVYERRVQLTAELKQKNPGRMIVPVQLRMQACNDRVCSAPETLSFGVSAVSTGAVTLPVNSSGADSVSGAL